MKQRTNLLAYPVGPALTTGRWLLGLLVVAWFGTAVPTGGQVPMPDLRQMAGTPLPSADLPDGVVSVRLVRGALSNSIVNHPVELRAGDKVLTARTDETGRAQFRGIAPATRAQAVAVVDGERLESQPFEIPAKGGVRILLAAGLRESETGSPASRTPQPGTVQLGGDSRFVVELDEEAVRIYALLDLVNPAQAPVTPPGPIVFELPRGAQGATVLEGSSSQATANGPRITVTGPFPPGTTAVRFAYLLPYGGSRLEVAQPLPVALEAVTVIVERRGDLRVRSPQIERTEELSTSGRRVFLGVGPGLPAGGTLHLTLEGLPHPPRWPQVVTLALAGLVLLWGAWATVGHRSPAGSPAAQRTLEARREKLFDELVRLEADHLVRPDDEATYRRRREELVKRLEQIYAQLDGVGSAGSGAVLAAQRRHVRAVDRSGATG